MSDERPIPDELARWMSASDGKLELTTAEIRRAGLELLRHRAAQTAGAERVRAVVREALRAGEMASIQERLDGALDRIADHAVAQLTAPPDAQAARLDDTSPTGQSSAEP